MSEIENLHIKELKIDNYKSLKYSTIELQSGLNIIIGKNGAGKSNLLEFIDTYSRTNNHVNSFFDYPHKGINSNFSFSLGYTDNNIENVFTYSVIRLKSQVSNEIPRTINYQIRFDKKEASEYKIRNLIFDDFKNDYRDFVLANPLLVKEVRLLGYFPRCLIKYNLPSEDFWLSKSVKFNIDFDNENDFEIGVDEAPSFSFLEDLQFELFIAFNKAIVKDLKKDYSKVREKLILLINTLIGQTNINHFLDKYTPISEIRISNNLNAFNKENSILFDNIFLEFRVDDDWLPWSYLSDGTKRLFYLISECISYPKKLILIEEPELGIHPHQFYKVLDFLQEQAQTKQVIISTHSPMALDILKPDELDRITIAKYDKGTKFLKLTDEQKEKAKRYMEEVGELSYYWLHSDLEND